MNDADEMIKQKNPFDYGWKKNLSIIFGTEILFWFLPLKIDRSDVFEASIHLV